MPICLCERLSFDKLFRISDPKRVYRSFTVRGPPLEIDSYQDTVYYSFNFKANPSTTGLRHRGYIKFFKPEHKNPKDVPLQHLDCVVDCMCFSGETLVLAEGGVYRRIKDIKVGDKVYTHKGRLRAVTRVQARKTRPDENVYNVEAAGFPVPMTVTGGHPFATLRGNDTCLCGCGKPLYGTETTKSNEQIEKVWSPSLLLSKKYRKGHYRGIRGAVPEDRSSGVFNWINVDDFRPKEWFLSPWLETGKTRVALDFARLVGYYAAEGCLPNKKGHGVRLTFNLDESETLVADVLMICRRLGYPATAKRAKQGNWTNVTILSKQFKQFCRKNVGQGASCKRLSSRVMRWSVDALLQVYAGMTLGDGWSDPEKDIRYVSTSFDLATQASVILSQAKIRSLLHVHGTTTTGKTAYAVSVPRGVGLRRIRTVLADLQRPKDRCVIADERRTHDLGFWRNDGQLRALQRRVKVVHNDLVYDITVEEDQSFIAHGIAVHNCPDYRYKWAWANKQRGSSRVGPNSLNQAWNRAPRITNPKGRPGLCKHILAARQYIYGLLSSFPSDEPDTAEKLNKLTKIATKRWTDFAGAMQAARERERVILQRRQARNVGMIQPEPMVPVTPPGQKVPPKKPVPPPGPLPQKGAPEMLPPRYTQPEPLPPAEPKAAGKKPPGGGLAIPPGQRGRGFPPASTKPEGKPKRVLGNRVVKGMLPGQVPGTWESLQNSILESVVKATGEHNDMSTLNDAIKLVEEMETDELALRQPEAGGDDFGAPEGGLDDMGTLDEPMEPPVSDAAIGADTEGETALGLLRQMKDLLLQIATAVAPEQMAGPGGEMGAEGEMGGMPGGAPGGEMGAEGMPGEPPDELGGGEGKAEGGEFEPEAERGEDGEKEPAEKEGQTRPKPKKAKEDEE